MSKFFNIFVCIAALTASSVVKAEDSSLYVDEHTLAWGNLVAQAAKHDIIGASVNIGALFGPVEITTIPSVDWRWMRTVMHHEQASFGVFRLCGARYMDCARARASIALMTEECPQTFRGVIDVGASPDTPENLWDAGSEGLIILKQPNAYSYATPVKPRDGERGEEFVSRTCN